MESVVIYQDHATLANEILSKEVLPQNYMFLRRRAIGIPSASLYLAIVRLARL